MKVLWFVNSCFPAVSSHMKTTPTGYGWWMVALADELANRNISLGIAWASPTISKPITIEEGDIKYYCIPSNQRIERIARPLSSIPLAKKVYRAIIDFVNISQEENLRDCISVVEKFDPDVIHVHGTENFYGLITPYVKQPVLLSFQGVLFEYVKYYWGSLSTEKRSKFPTETYLYRKMLKDSKRELKIIKANRYFSGRTEWDKACLYRNNLKNNYYYCQEVIRKIFYSKAWNINNCKKNTIYITSKPHPYKGVELVIEAIAILKTEFPKIHLNIGGPIYDIGFGRHLLRRIKELNVEENVTLLGHVNEEEIVDQILMANVFVLPSRIENSSNSLAEAQIMGAPCVASYSGGTTSMMQNNETGLFFPNGDALSLAYSIRRILTDPKLAISLGAKAREMALDRNNPDKIVNTQIAIYKEIIEQHKGL